MRTYPMQFGDVYIKFGKLKRMLLMAGNYQLATLIDQEYRVFSLNAEIAWLDLLALSCCNHRILLICHKTKLKGNLCNHYSK